MTSTFSFGILGEKFNFGLTFVP